MLPLKDVTVIAVEQAVAAPFASRHLADLGARVIKIERVGGGDFARRYDAAVQGLSSHFVWLNRSKESITIDLKREEGRLILEELLERADVFLHNLGPGAIEGMGFGTASLRAKLPHLITCEISGYGASGPYRSRKAYDLLIQAESGLLSITGTEAAPAKVGISVADIAGGMYAFSGILAALIKRGMTGEGSAVEISLLEALGEWMGYPAYYTGYSGKPPDRTGTRHATIAPYGDLAVGDGGVVYLGIQNEREWEKLCQSVLERPELVHHARFATNDLRVEHRDELFDIIESVLQSLTTDEVMERLEDANLAHAQVNDVMDFIQHPQLRGRNRWREIDSPVGALSALLPPANIEGVEPVMRGVPDVGEHTDRILSWLGLTEEDVRRLRGEGVVG